MIELDILTQTRKRLGIPDPFPREIRVVDADRVRFPNGIRTEVITGTPGRCVEICSIAGRPQYARADRTAGAKSKHKKSGRTDPSANFQNVWLAAPSEIDCHKSKRSVAPTRAQMRETEPQEIQQLLDEWESRTGKTSPSRR